MQENVKCANCGSFAPTYMTDGWKKNDFVLVCKRCGNTVRIVHGKRSIYQDIYEYIPREDCDVN